MHYPHWMDAACPNARKVGGSVESPAVADHHQLELIGPELQQCVFCGQEVTTHQSVNFGSAHRAERQAVERLAGELVSEAELAAEAASGTP